MGFVLLREIPRSGNPFTPRAGLGGEVMGVLHLGPRDLRSLWCALLLVYVGSQHGTALDWGPFGVGEWWSGGKLPCGLFILKRLWMVVFGSHMNEILKTYTKKDRRLTGN